MFEEAIYANMARGLMKGFLSAWTAQEIEDLIIKSNSTSKPFADAFVATMVPPEVAQGFKAIVGRYQDRITHLLTLRRLWAECEANRPDLLPVIARHQDWFKAWLAAIRQFVENGFQGTYSPE